MSTTLPTIEVRFKSVTCPSCHTLFGVLDVPTPTAPALGRLDAAEAHAADLDGQNDALRLLHQQAELRGKQLEQQLTEQHARLAHALGMSPAESQEVLLGRVRREHTAVERIRTAAGDLRRSLDELAPPADLFPWADQMRSTAMVGVCCEPREPMGVCGTVEEIATMLRDPDGVTHCRQCDSTAIKEGRRADLIELGYIKSEGTKEIDPEETDKVRRGCA